MSTSQPERVDHAAVTRVLVGDGAYDELESAEQAVIRAAWGVGIEERPASLDYAAEFRAAGLTWAEADVDGRTVLRS